MTRASSNKPLRVIGLMSGTSADGIDVAVTRISGAPPNLRAKLEHATSIPFRREIRQTILRIANGAEAPLQEISELNFTLGGLFADAILEACRRFRVPLSSVALIGSHGQTIFHQGSPSRVLGTRHPASTLQIGEPAIIAARTGITTIADFRPADMAVGGQGAPLVPFVDYLLYRDAKIGRVALNIGGIANVTVILAGAKPDNIFAFDTGPGNMIIDALMQHFSSGKSRFDFNAEFAVTGTVWPELLDKLLTDHYFRLRPPKSCGREQFGETYTKMLIEWAEKHRARPADLVRTATAFTALTIIDAWHRFVAPRAKIKQLIVAGGGAHNPLIMAQLSAALEDVEVTTSAALGVPEDGKEAFAFAILAYETFHGRPANLPSATGANRRAILGKVCYAPPR
jgi:anhydro-N-acetylmuramic acid kinase